jgi:hypothetical protein
MSSPGGPPADLLVGLMKALDAMDFVFRCLFGVVASECSRQLITMANARCTKWMQTANTRMKTAVAVVLVAVLVGYADVP